MCRISSQGSTFIQQTATQQTDKGTGGAITDRDDNKTILDSANAIDQTNQQNNELQNQVKAEVVKVKADQLKQEVVNPLKALTETIITLIEKVPVDQVKAQEHPIGPILDELAIIPEHHEEDTTTHEEHETSRTPDEHQSSGKLGQGSLPTQSTPLDSALPMFGRKQKEQGGQEQGGQGQQGEIIGMARDRDDGKTINDSAEALTKQQDVETLETMVHIIEETQEHQAIHNVETLVHQQMEAKEEVKKKILEESLQHSVHSLVEVEDPLKIKQSMETSSGGMESGTQGQQEVNQEAQLDDVEEDAVIEGTDKAREQQAEKTAHAKDLIKEAMKEAIEKKGQDPEEVMQKFKELMGKMPEADSGMSDGDKQKVIEEMEGLFKSNNFTQLSGDVQDNIMNFIDGGGAQKSIYQRHESPETNVNKTIELDGPLTGVTMKQVKEATSTGVVKNVNQISLKAGNDIDVSLKLVTSTMPTGQLRLVSDQLLGSSVDMQIKPGTTRESFNATKDATIGKLLVAFTDHATIGLNRDNLKAVLESAFDQVSARLNNDPSPEPLSFKVPINALSGSLQPGGILDVLPKVRMQGIDEE